MKAHHIIYLIMLFSSSTYGQFFSRSHIDSLQQAVSIEKGTERINTLLILAETYKNFNIDTALQYVHKAAEESMAYRYKWGYCKSVYLNASINYFINPAKVGVIESLDKCSKWFSNNGFEADEIQCHSLKTNSLFYIEGFEKAKDNGEYVITRANEFGDTLLIGKAWYSLMQIGDSFFKEGSDYSAKDSAAKYLAFTSDSITINNTRLNNSRPYVTTSWGRNIARSAYAEGDNWGNNLCKLSAAFNLGFGHAALSNLDSAMFYFDISLHNANLLGNQRFAASIYFLMGYAHKKVDSIQAAINDYQTAIDMHKEIQVEYPISSILKKQSECYVLFGNYDLAIPLLLESIELSKKYNRYYDLHISRINLSKLYIITEEYDKAFEILNEELIRVDTTFTDIVGSRSKGIIQQMFGEIYEKQGHYNEAIKFYELSVPSFHSGNTIPGAMESQVMALNCHVHQKDFERAELKLESIDSILKNTGYKPPGQYHLNKGILDYEKGRYDLSIQEFNKYLNTQELLETRAKEDEAYYGLYKSYSAINDHKKALEAFESYTTIKDSLEALEVKENIIRIESDYEIALRENEISELEKEQILDDFRLSEKDNKLALRQSYILLLVGGILLLSLVALILFRRYKHKKEKQSIALELETFQARQKAELADVKNTLFANISHEFRTPLTLIKVPIQRFIEKNNDPEDKPILDGVIKNTDELIKMVDELLELAKMTTGDIHLNESVFSLQHSFAPIKTNFQTLFDEKEINFSFENLLTNNLINADENRLKIVLNNLLKNAYSHTYQKGKVSCQIRHSNTGGVHITVTNSGDNIDAEDYPHIFDRYYRGNEEKYVGNGIGLSLCKEIVELHQGKIYADNSVENSVSFHVELPQSRMVDEKVEISNPEFGKANGQKEIDSVEHKGAIVDNLPRLLVVEDNSEMRNLIGITLKEDFEIVYAENGEIGEQLAIEKQPDLIISDIMMPRKDGFELLSALKNTFETSHIPVILLTAKAGSANRIQGLDQDADDYLVKPFNKNELKSRIYNLLRQRKQLQKLFTENPLRFISKDNSISKIDQEFLEKVQSVLESNYSNGDFTVVEFCHELALNRNSVHVKIKSYTGQSTAQFIKNFRLNKAAKMLLETEKAITDIFMECGFNSSQAFNKVFKAEFNLTPGQYRNQHRGNSN